MGSSSDDVYHVSELQIPGRRDELEALSSATPSASCEVKCHRCPYIGVHARLMTSVLIIPASALLVYAAFRDLTARCVPNWLSVAVFSFGVVIRSIDHSLRAGLLVSAITFAVLFALWNLKALGGGDVKLWAATVMLVTPNLSPEVNFILAVVLSGGALAMIYLILRFVLPPIHYQKSTSLVWRILIAEGWRINRGGSLPYALAIAGGALVMVLPQTLKH